MAAPESAAKTSFSEENHTDGSPPSATTRERMDALRKLREEPYRARSLGAPPLLRLELVANRKAFDPADQV
jgi:hypothetical protein